MDAHKGNEAEVPAETKSSDGDDEGEEGTANISQAVSTPTPTMEADLGFAKEVTVGDAIDNAAYGDVEETVNGTSATVDPDPLPPRASEGDGGISLDSTSTKQSSSTEGEGFASDATWEERTWKELVRLKEDMFWARIGGVRALQG